MRHDPTDECQADHCYSCHEDEPAKGAYLVCGECFHAYRTKGALRREYRRGACRTGRRALPWAPKVSWWALGWKLATTRVSKIFFCPLCLHDF